jgi:hypothetical protein
MPPKYSSKRIQFKVAIFALFSIASISVSNAQSNGYGQGNGFGQNSAPYNNSPPGPGQQAPDGSFVYGHPPVWNPANSNRAPANSNNAPAEIQMHNRISMPHPQGNGPTGMQAEIDRNVAGMRARGVSEDRIKTYVDSMKASPYAGGSGNYRMIAPGVKMYMNGMTPGQALSNVEHNGAVNNTIYSDGLERQWKQTHQGPAPQLSH